MQEVEAPRKVDIGLLVGGGAVIAVAAAAAYYIYSKDQLINEYLNLVKSYEDEQQRYSADGVITELEQEKLDEKEKRLNFLEWLIAQKGWLIDLINVLIKLGFLYWVVRPVTTEVIKRIRIRWPPKPPSFVCPECGKDLHTDYRLDRHLKREHPEKTPAEPMARDAWDYLIELPQEILDLISNWGPVELVRTKWDAWDAPLAVKIAIVVAVVVICILILIFAWWLLPFIKAGIAGFVTKAGFAVPAIA